MLVTENSDSARYIEPALARTTSRSLLLAYEVQRSTDPQTPHYRSTIEVRRSLDHGKTWSDPVTIFGDDDDTTYGYGSPSFITDGVTGQIFLMVTQYAHADKPHESLPSHDKKAARILMAYTTGNEESWDTCDISVQIDGANKFTSRKTVSGHGIQLKQGVWIGRMLQPMRVITADGTPAFVAVGSDDHGRTWWAGPPIEAVGEGGAVAELSDGRISMHIPHKNDNGTTSARRYFSMDGGRSFGPGTPVPRPEQPSHQSKDGPDISEFTDVLSQAGMLEDQQPPEDENIHPQWSTAFERCFPCARPGMDQARVILAPTVRPRHTAKNAHDLDELGLMASLNDGKTIYSEVAYVDGDSVDVDIVSLPELRLAVIAVETPKGIEVVHILLDDLGLKEMAYGWTERAEAQDRLLKANGFI